MGPTFPSPGPILLSVAATAVTLLVKSKLSKEMSKVDMANIKILEIKNTLMERIVSCSIFLLSNFSTLTLLL